MSSQARHVSVTIDSQPKNNVTTRNNDVADTQTDISIPTYTPKPTNSFINQYRNIETTKQLEAVISYSFFRLFKGNFLLPLQEYRETRDERKKRQQLPDLETKSEPLRLTRWRHPRKNERIFPGTIMRR